MPQASSVYARQVLVALSCLTLCNPIELQPFRLRCPWNSPDKNTGVGCHFLLWGIFLTQGSNPGLLYCRQILYQLRHHLPFGPPRGRHNLWPGLTRESDFPWRCELLSLSCSENSPWWISFIHSLVHSLITYLFHAMARHSSALAWKIPWTEDPGRLQSMGWKRVRHDWVTSLIHSLNQGSMVTAKD